MLKFYFKIKKYFKNNELNLASMSKKQSSLHKGFTLVELLAVIVVLAIIMLIAIPAVLDVMHSARRKSFVTYADRIGGLSSQKFMKDNIEGKSSGCYIYNIKDDFDLSNTGSFKGYVLVNSNSTEIKYYITLWNDDYMLVAYNYTDGINYKGQKKIIDESLEKYDSTRNEDIKPGTLCNYACNVCTYEGASNDPYDNSGDTSFEGDITKIKGATTLLEASGFKNKVKSIAGAIQNVVYIKKANTLNEEATKEIITAEDESSKDNPVYIWFENNTVYFYTEATKIFYPWNSESFFEGFNNLINMDEFIENIYSDKIHNAGAMFRDCKKLERLDLSHWNTKKISSLGSTFYNDTSLQYLNVSTWNTSNLQNLDGTFYNVSNLKTIDVSKWDVSKVGTLAGTFYNMRSLESIDVSNWKTGRVTELGRQWMWGTFENCSSLTSLDLSKWDVSNVRVAWGFLKGCNKIKNIDVNNWDTSRMTDISYFFSQMTSLESLELSNWDTKNIKSFYTTFEYLKLDELDLSNWDTRNLENMQWTFLGANIKNLNLKGWNTSKVNTMAQCFANFRTSYLDLTSFSLNSLTNLSQTFIGSNIKVINISTWDTSKIKYMGRMFFGNSIIEHIYVGSKWSIESLDLGDAVEMFYGNSKLPNFNGTMGADKAYVGPGGYLEYPPN